jgi:rhamnogalacturonyl hydrolase YesR
MRLSCLLLSLLAVSPALAQVAADSDAAKNVAIMRRACDWQLANLPTTRVSRDHANNGWVRAPFFLGTLALYRQTHDEKYLNAILTIARQNDWQPGARFRHADDQAVGQVYGELYFLQHDPAMIAPMRDRWDKIIAQPMAGRVDWWWCDALFMAPPALAELGAATGDRKYFDFLNQQFWDVTDFLYDKSEHLYFRDKSFFDSREANEQKVFWSRGNGWVLAGIARVLQFMPADYPARAKYVQLFKDMSARIITLQQPDGFWRTSLLDPASCPGGESSGTGFFCYAMAWGVNNGILPRDKFGPAILNGWKALSGAVDSSGKLQWVQQIGSKPGTIKQSDTAEYGVGAFLLAGSEIIKMSDSSNLSGVHQ